MKSVPEIAGLQFDSKNHHPTDSLDFGVRPFVKLSNNAKNALLLSICAWRMPSSIILREIVVFSIMLLDIVLSNPVLGSRCAPLHRKLGVLPPFDKRVIFAIQFK